MSGKTNTPVEILMKFYAAEAVYMSTSPDSPDASANFNAMVACLAPDVKVYQPKYLPWGGTWEGTEGLVAWGKMMTEYFDKNTPEPIRIFDDGLETVVIESIVHIRLRKTAEEHDVRLVQIATVDIEKGVIKDIRQYPYEIEEILAKLKA